MSHSQDPSDLGRIAGFLADNKREAAQCLFSSIADWDKFAPSVKALGNEAFIDWEIIPLVDYLINYLRTSDSTWRNLYAGERLKQLHSNVDSLEQMIARRADVLTRDRDSLLALLNQHFTADALVDFTARLDEVIRLATTGARESREIHLLLVGDCLFLDTFTFLALPLLEYGITLRPVFATSKNPIELRNTLRGLTGEKFDLVCYSPYTYEFNLLFAQTHYGQGIFTSRRELRNLAQKAHDQTRATLTLLTSLFECNIAVHNTANIRRHNHTLVSWLKTLVTRLPRRYAAREANVLLERTIAELNQTLPRSIVTIDETALLDASGEFALGRKFYDSEPQHPAVMAQKLSEVYTDLIASARHLFKRKVIVTDLDHTLWHGVIGEGAVQHDRRRQRALQMLKQKGVVLAIASKNDPKNIHWDGALLNENDFVAAQVNWDPKTINIKKIASELNMKIKDFVFIDDRADEREMARLAMPEMHSLDATNDASWRMLEWWAAALPEQNETDRTQLYHERRQRQSFLDVEAEKRDQQELLATLNLRLDIRYASRKDLARVAELINRTNQFNMCGSRTTLQQVTAWSESPNHKILVADAADKFGSMGLISVLVFEIGPGATGPGEIGTGALDISTWVLSCRVFGYGIENAMINYVRRIGQRMGITTLRGHYTETASNQPCRETYPSNGFSWDGAYWVSTGEARLADPEWLSVRAEDEPTLV